MRACPVASAGPEDGLPVPCMYLMHSTLMLLIALDSQAWLVVLR